MGVDGLVGFPLQLGLDVLAWLLRIGLVGIVVVGVLHGGQVWWKHVQAMKETLEPSLAANAACPGMVHPLESAELAVALGALDVKPMANLWVPGVVVATSDTQRWHPLLRRGGVLDPGAWRHEPSSGL